MTVFRLEQSLYVISNMAIKLSIALMLLRFTLENTHRYIIYAVTGVLELYSLAFFFIFVFQCTPPSFFWTRLQNASAGQCMNPDNVIKSVYIYSAITCATDWTMALLPWFLVKDLQMSRRTKVSRANIQSRRYHLHGRGGSRSSAHAMSCQMDWSSLVGVDNVCYLDTAICSLLELWQDSARPSEQCEDSIRMILYNSSTCIK